MLIGVKARDSIKHVDHTGHGLVRAGGSRTGGTQFFGGITWICSDGGQRPSRAECHFYATGAGTVYSRRRLRLDASSLIYSADNGRLINYH